MKKKDIAFTFIKENIHLLQCPVCKNSFSPPEDYRLECTNNHSFDLSKKGTVHFLLGSSKNEYDRSMLESRSRIAKKGLWNPMLKKVLEKIEHSEGNHLDIGCGEGSHLHYLTENGLMGNKIGFDISKDAIQLASAQYTDAFWCVADLADSAFASSQYHTLLNILSPANYAEFKRLSQPNSQVIKVVPNTDYLKELRHALYEDAKPYSNKEVVESFISQYPDATSERVRYTLDLDGEEVSDLIHMTPLAWNTTRTKIQTILASPFTEITVDLTILTALT